MPTGDDANRREVTNRVAVNQAALHEQMEALFDTVWRCEANWDLDDRIELASGLADAQHRRHPPPPHRR